MWEFRTHAGQTVTLELVRWATAVLGVVAAIFALRAATIHVRESIDDFISDIHRQSSWATLSAVVTSLTALLLVVQTFLDR